MKVTYDKDVDAAYIYLKETIGKGEVKNSISINENIIIDFDASKKLIGIEILSASGVVPKKAIETMQTA
ncbi:DUF2283 domain-containing protein [Candidatus Micrarchaeota archaeon]|nr:DUF2283 domain-containing protein [Candidatus Micrarchaeota archaeon]